MGRWRKQPQPRDQLFDLGTRFQDEMRSWTESKHPMQIYRMKLRIISGGGAGADVWFLSSRVELRRQVMSVSRSRSERVYSSKDYHFQYRKDLTPMLDGKMIKVDPVTGMSFTAYGIEPRNGRRAEEQGCASRNEPGPAADAELDARDCKWAKQRFR